MDADGKSRFVCFGSLCIQTVIVTAADMASDTQEGLGLLLIIFLWCFHSLYIDTFFDVKPHAAVLVISVIFLLNSPGDFLRAGLW